MIKNQYIIIFSLTSSMLFGSLICMNKEGYYNAKTEYLKTQAENNTLANSDMTYFKHKGIEAGFQIGTLWIDRVACEVYNLIKQSAFGLSEEEELKKNTDKAIATLKEKETELKTEQIEAKAEETKLIKIKKVKEKIDTTIHLCEDGFISEKDCKDRIAQLINTLDAIQ